MDYSKNMDYFRLLQITKNDYCFVTNLPGKKFTAHGKVIKPQALEPLRQVQLCGSQDFAVLPSDTKHFSLSMNLIMCIPLKIKIISFLFARDVLASLWGFQLSTNSPASSSGHNLQTILLAESSATTRLLT